VLAHFVAEVLLVTIRPGHHKQRRGRDVTLHELQVEPIRLRLRSPLREHPATKPRRSHSRSSRTSTNSISIRAGTGIVEVPGGEEREHMERAEEAGGHGLADELPERGRVVREAEVGDENPRQVRAGDPRALPSDDAGQLHRPQQWRVPARLRRLHGRHDPPLQIGGAGGDQPRRIRRRRRRRRRHDGVLAEGLGLDFASGRPG
jgi:hypothetical protein